MADLHERIQTDPPPAQAPLLNSNQNHNHNHTQQHQQRQNQNQNQNQITDLDQTLEKLETFLSFLGFNQSSVLSFVLSWSAFIVIGVLLPVVILELSNCPGCEKGQIKNFELDMVASQACLAAVSLLCLSHNLRKYGIRRFLFVDRYRGQVSRFRNQYIQQIKVSISHISKFDVIIVSLLKLGIDDLLHYTLRDTVNLSQVYRKISFNSKFSNLIVIREFGLDNLFTQGSMRLLLWWSLPCFILKTAREVIRILYVRHESWWLSTAILLALILSWTYLSTISLSASILFHLVCNLQVIHFDDYAKLLERESDVLVLIEEHTRLRYHLSKISHKFRIYLLLDFLVVTTSQVVTLFQTTGYSGMITFINGGDFAVSAIVQVVGIIICLHAATKISHRAQNIASLACRWHALATCSTAGSQLRTSNSVGNLANTSSLNSLSSNYSESDLESLDYVSMPANTQLASYMCSYHNRQAFGMDFKSCSIFPYFILLF
ncbi:hypothetical protein JRO89_XS05G0109700 [Xanthoceras sorbifolium]|uniref:Gustatory receptor n=1 Tax=Xanthoceras sorbifolium TaxID=99658 RepID=A0ABQ8I1Z6_9ROSI|nr:hypothetical protein JRO89_XS05G0109700 [Xanthoceras sorbifolium]